MTSDDMKMPEISQGLIKALDANDLDRIVKLQRGKLIITNINYNAPVDCDYPDCDDFAEKLIYLVSGDGEDKHGNFCVNHTKEHIEFAKTHPAYIVH